MNPPDPAAAVSSPPVDADPTRRGALDPFIDELMLLSPEARRDWLADRAQTAPALAGQLQAMLESRTATPDTTGAVPGDAAAGHAPVQMLGPSVHAGDLLGAYTLLAPIGRGGMGSVWSARRSAAAESAQGGEAAVKLLRTGVFDAASQARFRREAAILARLRHPGIAQLLDTGITPAGQPYLVLELVQGEHIDRWCDKRRVGVRARVELMVQALDAVAAAHAQLVIHRDLKPSNILVADGQVKLLDFGIARLLHEDVTEPALTREGALALTPQYAAPEQCDGQALSLSTDVFALGVVLYELLTGAHPSGLVDADALQYMQAAREGFAVEPSRRALLAAGTGAAGSAEARARDRGESSAAGLRRQLQGDLDNILMRALAREPWARYSTAPEFADDLRAYLEHRPVRAHSPGLGYRIGKYLRRRRLAVSVAASVTLALLVGGGTTLWQAREAIREHDAAVAARDRAERLLAGNDAVNEFTSMLLTELADVGRPVTLADIVERGEALAGHERSVDPAGEASVWLMLGGLYSALGQADKTRSVAERALAVARESGDRGLMTAAQCLQSSVVMMGGDLAQADRLLEQALQQAPAQPEVLADCWQRRAFTALARFDGARGLEYSRQAIANLDAMHRPVPTRKALMLIDIADALSLLGQARESDRYYRESLEMLRSVGRSRSTAAASALNSWGSSDRRFGRTLAALGHYEQSVQITDSVLGREAIPPAVAVNMARLYVELAQPEPARQWVQLALRRAEAHGEMLPIQAATLTSADILRLQGRFDDAKARLDEARTQIGEHPLGSHPLDIALQVSTARLARARGDAQAGLGALDGLEAVLRPAAGAGGPALPASSAVAVVLIERAELEADLGRLDAAGRDAEQALAVARRLQADAPASSATGEALLTAARIALARGDRATGRRLAEQAHQQLTATLGSDHPSTRRALQVETSI